MSEKGQNGSKKNGKHLWKPGESGNPKGGKPGPRGPSLTSRLKDVLDQNYGEARKALIAAGVKAALGDPQTGTPPDFRFWNAIYERLDGKVPVPLVAGDEGGSIFVGITRSGMAPDSDLDQLSRLRLSENRVATPQAKSGNGTQEPRSRKGGGNGSVGDHEKS